MRLPNVCSKNLLLFAVSICFAIHPAVAQDKYFQITDDGLYYFFNETTIEQNNVVKGDNNYTRPITARTFFLEAQKAELFADDFSFTDFQRMSITEQQQLLDSLQHDFDWAKYRVSETPEAEKAAVDLTADTLYTVQNLAYNKETTTLYGDLISGTGRKQKFMVYPILKTNKGEIRWVFEWIELDLFLKRQGYKDLELPENKIYEGLLLKGISTSTLNALLNER